MLNLTVLGREDKAGTIVPVTAGALLPDLPMMVFYAYAKLWQGISEHVIWTKAYHAADWQTVFNLFDTPYRLELRHGLQGFIQYTNLEAQAGKSLSQGIV